MSSPSSCQHTRLLLCLWLLFNAFSTATSSPLHVCSVSLGEHCLLLKRLDPLVTLDNGTQIVIDPTTMEPVPQGRATDGAGHGFDPPAVVWLVWSLLVGIPLALAGVRLSRATTGAAIGITCTCLLWAAFVNTLGAAGMSDLLLAILALGAFGFGFLLGSLNMGRVIGITLLAIMGGMSMGVRIVLFRPGLLVPIFYVNWLIICLCGIPCFVLVLIRQRTSIIVGSAALGTFLVGLGIDLAVSQQKGMSWGLRFLFDRNGAHLVELITVGWHPPIMTAVIMAVSLAAVPPLAVMQHMVFKQPFRRVRSTSIASLESTPSLRHTSSISTKATSKGAAAGGKSRNGSAEEARDPEETETLNPSLGDLIEKEKTGLLLVSDESLASLPPKEQPRS